jgi:MFS family permease
MLGELVIRRLCLGRQDGAGMRTALARVWTVFITIAFVQLANALQTDLLSVRADLEAFRPDIIGYVMSAYYVGYSLAPLTGRFIIGKLGHVVVIIVMSVLAAAFIALAAFLISPGLWAIFRGISGFVLSTLYIAIESWIHDSVENEARGRVFSVYMVVQLVSMTSAQALFAGSDPRLSGPFLLAGALFFVSGMPVIRAKPVRNDLPPEPFGIIQLFRISPLGASITILAGVSWSMVFTFGPIYARHAGFGVQGTASFMAAAMVGGAVMQFPFGWLSDHLGRRATLAIMSALAVAASVLGLWADGHGAAMKLVASFLVGGFVFTLYAISAARTNDRVAAQNRVAAAAGLVLLFGLGSILGPTMSGHAVASLGSAGYFIVLALTMSVSLAATALRR